MGMGKPNNFTTMVRALSILTVMELVSCGCARKPPEKVAHGADHNLFKKSELLAQPVGELRTFNLMTGKGVAAGKMSKKQRLFLNKIEGEKPAVASFDISENYLTN